MTETTRQSRPAWAEDAATLELVFHAALSAGDSLGAIGALKLMVPVDPRRAALLLDLLRLSLAMAQEPETAATALRAQAAEHLALADRLDPDHT